MNDQPFIVQVSDKSMRVVYAAQPKQRILLVVVSAVLTVVGAFVAMMTIAWVNTQ